MLILTVAFNTVAGHRLQHKADDELHTRAAAVATTVDTGGPTVRVLETSHDDLLDANVWIYTGHRLLEGPPGTGPLNPIAGQLAAQHGRHCVATVVTALDLTPYRSSAHTLLVGSLTLDAVRPAPPTRSSGTPPSPCARSATPSWPTPATTPRPLRASPRSYPPCAD